MFKRIKQAINKYLQDMARENEKLYGKERMDCCKLNKSKKG
ncbi:LDCC motif putative metal-binding protein [Anaerocolumna aminovalerica]|nr:LDCC motif putative metal-binding protein [Anaerocolumna aminovalerica]